MICRHDKSDLRTRSHLNWSVLRSSILLTSLCVFLFLSQTSRDLCDAIFQIEKGDLEKRFFLGPFFFVIFHEWGIKTVLEAFVVLVRLILKIGSTTRHSSFLVIVWHTFLERCGVVQNLDIIDWQIQLKTFEKSFNLDRWIVFSSKARKETMKCFFVSNCETANKTILSSSIFFSNKHRSLWRFARDWQNTIKNEKLIQTREQSFYFYVARETLIYFMLKHRKLQRKA